MAEFKIKKVSYLNNEKQKRYCTLYIDKRSHKLRIVKIMDNGTLVHETVEADKWVAFMYSLANKPRSHQWYLGIPDKDEGYHIKIKHNSKKLHKFFKKRCNVFAIL